ncbi:MAG: exonuclease domain-containing protein [Gammaproteobacteria bacterium]
MKRHSSLLFAILACLAVLGPVVLLFFYAGASEPAGRGFVVTALALSATAALIAAGLWRIMSRRIASASRALARDLRTLSQAKRVDRALRDVGPHELGDLPSAIAALVDELRGARREMVRAMASATARAEQEKGWLEHILLELVPQGVVVCNLEHQVLLYNHAASGLFEDLPAFGLGRSLAPVLSMSPLEHALERLELMLKAGRRDPRLAFVCETADSVHLLEARIALVLDSGYAATGYALSVEDISAEVERRRTSTSIERAITHDVRGPLASLRAAAETLSRSADLPDARRRAFVDIVVSESAKLSAIVQQASEASERRRDGGWPMSEVHSADLLSLLAERLAKAHGSAVEIAGAPVWLAGDSHLLLAVLFDLARAIEAHASEKRIEVEAGHHEHRSFIELRYEGEATAAGALESWLDRPLSLAPELTVREALELHGSEPWSKRDEARPGAVTVHVPLRTASEPESAATGPAANPERYDFNLMYAQSFTGELGERRLDSLNFVVFDTETTGLRPAAGDAMISIAGVRVANGRLLGGETFESLINPGRPIPKESIRFHGITDDRVAGEPPIEEVLPRFHAFAGSAVLVAHNAAFDMRFLKLREAQCGLRFDNAVIDTLLLSLLVDGDDEDHSLDGICDRLNVEIEGRHSALGDAMATAHVLVHLLERLRARGVHTFKDVMRATDMEDQLRARAHQF